MSGKFLLHGKTAVVTGAASGIGRGLAQSLARRGCHLALADIDESGLAETASLLTGGRDVCVSRHRLDVADPTAVAAFPALVTAQHPNVDLLFNNAGVAVGGTFEQTPPEDFAWLFGINFWGVVNLTRAFLPLLRARPEAWLVNMSSLFGLLAPAEQSAYSASKFAVRGFTQSLRQELAGSTVGVTLVHPGGVNTQIVDRARMPPSLAPEFVAAQRQQFKKLLRMSAERAAELIVAGVERRKTRLLVGPETRFLSLLERLAPVRHADLFTWLTRRFNPQGSDLQPRP